MSDADRADLQCEDDLELLRQAALTSLLKKKSEASTTNAVFYRPSRNSNLISIQPVPVVADVITLPPQPSGYGEDNCATDSEDEIIIAEGLSVSSSDCDEIVEEVVVSEDDENNNAEKAQESSEGEDAVSVASKDSFDEILNSIEEEINGGTKKDSTTLEAKNSIKPKSEERSRKDNTVAEPSQPSRRLDRSPERNYKTRSRSSSYGYRRSSPGGRGRRTNYSGFRGSRSRNTSRSRSPLPLRRRTRSRSPNKVNHSSYRNVPARRAKSPIELTRHRQSNIDRQEDKLLINGRRRRSRSPLVERGRSRSKDRRKRDDRVVRSPITFQQKTQAIATKPRSRSTSRNRRTDRGAGSAKVSPVRNETDNIRDSRRIRPKEAKEKSPASPPEPESWQNLTAEQKDRLEKRKQKFKTSDVKVSGGKIVLKPKNEDSSSKQEQRNERNEPVKITRTIESDSPSEEVYNERQPNFSKERLERKLKLSSRLGVKVTEEEANAQQSSHIEEEDDEEDSSPNREITGRLVESLESFETPSALAEQQQTATLHKEDLRSKLEQKRATGGGRLFTFALRDTFDEPSKEKKRRRKISMK